MPGGDRTGPAGMGPMTGRGMGYCAGYPVPGFMNPGFGRGWGLWGGGRGWRNMYWATGLPGWARFGYGGWPGAYPAPPAWAPQWTAQDEANALRQQAEMLQNTLDEINRRLEQLSQETEEQED